MIGQPLHVPLGLQSIFLKKVSQLDSVLKDSEQNGFHIDFSLNCRGCGRFLSLICGGRPFEPQRGLRLAHFVFVFFVMFVAVATIETFGALAPFELSLLLVL